MIVVLGSILMGIAAASVAWGIVSSLMITGYLQKRGVKINWIFLRIFVIKYVSQYRASTRQETGRTGPWFYSFLIAMNVALVTAIIGFILRAQ